MPFPGLRALRGLAQLLPFLLAVPSRLLIAVDEGLDVWEPFLQEGDDGPFEPAERDGALPAVTSPLPLRLVP